MADDAPQFPPGKLPAAFLASMLERYTTDDPRVLLGPRVGADAAAIDMGDQVLIAKTDPITFPAPDAGHYLVNINANDVACMGGEPKWLLVTALLPEEGSTPTLVDEIFASLSDAAESLGITLIGGHTEITIGLDRPILVGQMLGETTRSQLLDLRRTRPGDRILLCNGIAIEGTSILANEASRADLHSVADELIVSASAFVQQPGISVVPAARVLRQSGAEVRGLHDPTEGGLATALHELADITNLGLEIERAAVPIYRETAEICAALDLDPLGLIASGALLAIVSDETLRLALASLHDAGIEAAAIGTMLEDSQTRVILDESGQHALPSFTVDEIARYFADQ